MIGIDLHKRESQLCSLAADGTVTERRIVTSRERFTAVFGNRVPARVLLEASTESEWVDAIAAREDRQARDARTLAEALKLGAYRPAHRVSAEWRHARAELEHGTIEEMATARATRS